MYDAVIIGAGIGGLVCGCTLAKAGMKVLIVEQHSRPGGYCTSFRRGRFLFDAGPHCFGSYREGGQMRRILEGLGISEKLKIQRPDPCDTVTTPKYQVRFWRDPEKTEEEFKRCFPREHEHIGAFFSMLSETRLDTFVRLRHLTLEGLLDTYFTDRDLKTLFALPLVGIGGLPPSRMSACVAAQFYSEFLLDGGYIPVGGMQVLSDELVRRFQEFGGTVLLSRRVRRIATRDRTVIGVISENEDLIPARFVVSNGDARQTYFDLLGEDILDPDFASHLRTMEPSLSSFLIYLGMDERFISPFTPGTVNHFFGDHDAEKAYNTVTNASIPNGQWYAIRSSLDSTAVYIEMLSPYHSDDHWLGKKDVIVDGVMATIEKNHGPAITDKIIFREAATPQTLHRYTLNYQGAAYGWAGTVGQTIVPGIRKPSFVRNLFLVGHWTTLAVGISGVAYVGADTAAMMLRHRKGHGSGSSVSL